MKVAYKSMRVLNYIALYTIENFFYISVCVSAKNQTEKDQKVPMSLYLSINVENMFRQIKRPQRNKFIFEKHYNTTVTI